MKNLKEPNTVGIREFRSRLGHYVKLLRRGQRLTLTDRGQVLARVTPQGSKQPSQDPDVEALIKAGYQWSGKKPVFPRPGIKIKGGPMSDTVLEDRR